MRIKQSALAVIILVLIFGTIAITTATGLWTTQGLGGGMDMGGGANRIPATYTDGDYAGMYNPADIRGVYTFGQISDFFDIPLSDLGKAFAIQDESLIAGFQCSQLESLYSKAASQGKGVNVVSIRLFVAWYKGLPIDDTGGYLPDTAADVLIAQGNLTEEQKDSLAGRLVPAVPVGAAP